MKATHFARFLFVVLDGPELHARAPARLTGGNTRALQLCRALGNMKENLLVGIGVEAATAKEPVEEEMPAHRSDLLGTCVQHVRHRRGDAIPALRLLAQPLLTLAGQAVVLRAAVVVRRAPLA